MDELKIQKKLKRYKKLKKLIEQWTRAEVMSRVGECRGMGYGDYFMESLNVRDKIREMLYGTSDLIELAAKFDLPVSKDIKTKRK